MATRNERERREVRKTSAADWAKQPMGSFEATSVKAPDGVGFFSLKAAGVYEIDVVPYVTGKGNPDADEDYEHFVRTYYAHRNMGLEGKSTYCCARTFGEPCPICAWIAKHGGSDPDTAQRIKQQIRQLWCVIDLNHKDKGVQIFDAAFFKSFGEMMKNKLKARQKYNTFADLEGGYTLILTVEEQSFGKGGKFNAVTNIEMEPRDTVYPDSVRDNAPCLDDCLIHRTKEELEKILHETVYGEVDEGKESPKEDKPRVPDRTEGPGPQPPTSNGRNTLRRPKEEDEPEEKPSRRESRGDEGRPDARGNTRPAEPVSEWKLGEWVEFDNIRWTVKRLNKDGSLDLEDDDGNLEPLVSAAEVKRIKVRGRENDKDAVPVRTASPSRKEEAKDEDNDAPPPRRGRPAKS